MPGGFDYTIVAQATPLGVSAISVYRLSGPQAIGIASHIFRGRNLEDAPSHTVHYGPIVDGDKIVDDVVVTVFRAPHSYTGEDVVEIGCHGSPFIGEQLVRLVVAQGARLAAPGEFTMRAFLNGKMDLTQAEAVADLIAASSSAQHTAAVNQLRGGVSSRIHKLREELIRFAALIELELDFSEENVEFADRLQLTTLLNEMLVQLQELIESFQLGNAVKNGVVTVIAGRPNAGKSTLLNALLKEERALVSEIPGTTRDTIEEVLHIGGIPFRLVDTAGIREAEDAIERLGVERTLDKIKRSAIVIYLFDVAQGSVEEAMEDTRAFAGQVLLVANKSDLGSANVLPDSVISISAREGTNLEAIKTRLLLSVTSDLRNVQNAMVTSQRHEQALIRAREAIHTVRDALAAGTGGELLALDLRVALDALGEITGEIASETLLQSIFEKFCIGK